MSYQNHIGGCSIDTSGGANGLTNAAFTVPGSTVDYGFFTEFRIDAIRGTPTTSAIIRWGMSVGLTNTFRIHLNQTDGTIRINMRTSSNQVPITVGSYTVGHNYRLVCIGSTTVLNSTNYPGANGTSDRVAVYLYDMGTDASPVRTPTASAVFVTDVDLANPLLTTSTGVFFGANDTNSDITFGECFAVFGTLPTVAQCNLWGQYAADMERLGLTISTGYRLSHYSTSAVSGTPTGDEAFNLADRGAGGYDLTPTGTGPTWTTDAVRVALTSTEDTVQAITFGDHQTSLTGIRTALAGPAGALLVVQGDSQALSASNRAIRPMMKALMAEGFELVGIAPRLRSSGDPVVMSESVNTGADIAWFCNAALGGTFNTNPGGASVRYGYPGCGGMLQLTRNGDLLQLGAGNEFASVVADNQLDATDWATAADDLYARIFFYLTDDGSQFNGTVQLVGASTVEVDLASTTQWRQFPHTGSGGDSTDLYPNCWTTDVPLGTGAAARTLSLRLKTPAEFTLGQKLIVGVALVYKQRSGVRVSGPNTFTWINDAESSSSWDDLYTDAVSTADGDKGRSITQEWRYLSLLVDDATTRVCRIVWMQTENESQATVAANLATWDARWATICTNLGCPTPYSVLMALPTNNVDGDTVVNDRQHAIDYDAAYWEFAGGRNGAWSAFRWTEGFLLATAETVADAALYTLGIGEGDEVADDATLFARLGSVATCFVGDLLHVADTTFTAAMGAAWAADVAAASAVSARISRVDRVGRTPRV